MPMIYPYEVELKLTNRNTRQERLVTRLEHAYSVSDAMSQAIYGVGSECDLGSSEIAIVRIGPPQADILATAGESRRIAEQVHELLGIGKTGKR